MSETARGGTRYYGTSLAIYHVTSPMGQQLPEEVRWGQTQCTVHSTVPNQVIMVVLLR